jgi:hypothetical protein
MTTIDDLHRMMADLEGLCIEHLAALHDLAQHGVRADIAGGFGHVRVNQSNLVLGVGLDRHAIRRANEAALGRAIAQAIEVAGDGARDAANVLAQRKGD